jgi:hypothetical protein
MYPGDGSTNVDIDVSVGPSAMVERWSWSERAV